ncbi:N-acetyltransferase [Brevundimonas sp.]|uniref:N-acetyltransferase n=1 Tax=Brevundimonas sp. TaxID=1871086 RepID=UPI002D626A06|nr:N-acetyltransferase [Brevundimonas sp.]HYC99118.1 N-acetyltransferase [Brevundimonas sp.]
MMKLYYSPGACSLADHIALLEVGAKFETEAVDIRTKRTASGEDFRTINPKGYVPALVLDDCEILTENIAVLDWIAEQYPQLRRNGSLSRTRQLEMLSFISTEIHRAFKPLWHGGGEAEKQTARDTVASLLGFTADRMQGDYLFGRELSVADCYLFVMLRWAGRFGIAVPEALLGLQRRMEQRPSVQAALLREEASMPRARSSSPVDVEVRENAGLRRFERPIRDDAVAAAYYTDEDGKLVFIHTEVPSEFSGQGIATALARGTFDLLRQSGRKAVLACPFMVRFANAHPEYADVVVG